MRSALFWDLSQPRMVILQWHFRTTYQSHLQGSSSPRRMECLTLEYRTVLKCWYGITILWCVKSKNSADLNNNRDKSLSCRESSKTHLELLVPDSQCPVPCPWCEGVDVLQPLGMEMSCLRVCWMSPLWNQPWLDLMVSHHHQSGPPQEHLL